MGFEPTFAKKAKAVFKTATISHSVTPPEAKFQFLLKIMSAPDVKLALFFTPFTAGGKTSASNAITSEIAPTQLYGCKRLL